jgi:hypothetical protein
VAKAAEPAVAWKTDCFRNDRGRLIVIAIRRHAIPNEACLESSRTETFSQKSGE